MAGNVNVDTLIASFDSAWDGCEISVIFSAKDNTVRTTYADGMNVPHEVLSNAGYLYVTFVGVREGNVVIETALQAKPFIIDKEGVVDGADPEPPTPSEYQQLMSEISRIRADIEAGLLKGDKGDPGQPGRDGIDGNDGAPGRTPVITATKSGKVTTVKADGVSIASINDGADGLPGQPGMDGYTPIKGVDYFDGAPGAKGDPFTYDDFTPEQLAELQGPQGDPGPKGDPATATDVRINGSSIVVDGVADIPIASDSLGVARYNSLRGASVSADGLLSINRASNYDIDGHGNAYKPIVPANIDYAVKAAMCDGKGAAWSYAEKLAARQRMGFGGDFELIEEITVSESVALINRDKTPNGAPYNFAAMYFETETPSTPTAANGYIKLNGNDALGLVYALRQNQASYTRTFALPMNGNVIPLSSSGTATFAAGTASTYTANLTQLPLASLPITSIAFRLASGNSYPVGTKIRIYGAWA